MKNYEALSIPNDDDSDVGNPDYLLAYREYYAGRIIIREGEYEDTFPSVEDPFLEGLQGHLDEQDLNI